MKFQSLVFLTLPLLVTTNSYSFDRSTLKIGGNITQKVKAEKVVNVGIGLGVRAHQSIGSIHKGISLKGNVKQDVKVKKAVNIGIGLFNRSCQSIGSMGDKSGC